MGNTGINWESVIDFRKSKNFFGLTWKEAAAAILMLQPSSREIYSLHNKFNTLFFGSYSDLFVDYLDYYSILEALAGEGFFEVYNPESFLESQRIVNVGVKAKHFLNENKAIISGDYKDRRKNARKEMNDFLNNFTVCSNDSVSYTPNSDCIDYDDALERLIKLLEDINDRLE